MVSVKVPVISKFQKRRVGLLEHKSVTCFGMACLLSVHGRKKYCKIPQISNLIRTLHLLRVKIMLQLFYIFFRVDFVKYPGLIDVEYYNVTMQAGDCLYIPHRW